jgi:cell division protein FtsW
MLLDKLEECYAYFCHRKAGWFILIVVGLLSALGVVVLSSASLSFIKSDGYFSKQILWCAIGLPFFLIGCLADLDFFKKYAHTFPLIFAVLLVVVLIPGIGKLVNGARRWIVVGSLHVQVSEFAKITMVIWLAQYLAQNRNHIGEFRRGFFIPLANTGVICLLIFLEPDYGTAMLIGGVVFTLMFLAGVRLLFMALAMGGGILSVATLVYFNHTRMRRITAFLDIDNNKLGGAYQLWQGMLGFASGGLFGNGLGQGRQQLAYLPESHTDFIFPILSEELGSLAAIATLLAYVAVFFVTWHCSEKFSDDFVKLLSRGVVITVAYQVVINVGVVTGLLPTKGIGLPFISYGGSNLVLLFFMVGLLINCFSTATEKN